MVINALKNDSSVVPAEEVICERINIGLTTKMVYVSSEAVKNVSRHKDGAY